MAIHIEPIEKHRLTVVSLEEYAGRPSGIKVSASNYFGASIEVLVSHQAAKDIFIGQEVEVAVEYFNAPA